MDYKLNKEQHLTLKEITKRANDMNIKIGNDFTLEMDITLAVQHFNLDLEKLLEANTFNFAHDIIGIQNNIDREKKEFNNYFVLRFSREVK